MQKTISLKENRDFSRLYRRGKSCIGDCLVIYYKYNQLEYNRLGLTVSGKLGKAVIRNRIRRRIKESYRSCEEELKASYDIVIVARVRAAASDYRKIRSCLRYLFYTSALICGDKKA